MEGTSYVQKTFGEVSQTLEKLDAAESSSSTTTTEVEQPQNTTQENEAEVKDTVAVENQEVKTEEQAENETENKEDNTSSFSLSLDEGEQQGENKKQEVVEKSTSNWKDSLKNVDKKEVLKELGITDFAIEMNEHISNGGKAEDYLMAKAIDYSKVSDESIIKDDLRKQFPDFTAAEIDRLFIRKYPDLNSDLEDEKQDALLQLRADAHIKRQQKIGEQSKFKIADTPMMQTSAEFEEWQKAKEQQPKLLENFRNFYNNHEATKSLNEGKRVAISLGDGIAPFNFNVDHPELITQALTDGGVILNKLTSTKTGEPDVAKQHLITLFSFNPQKFMQDIFNYGQQMGVRKKVIEEGQNAQKPQAKVAEMNTSTKPTVVGTGTYGSRSRD